MSWLTWAWGRVTAACAAGEPCVDLDGLHFRQVLGRILRRQPEDPADTSAWLYVLAEPNLAEFARSIGEDLPGDRVVSFALDSETLGTQKSKAMKSYQDDNFALTLDLGEQASVEDPVSSLSGIYTSSMG